MKKLIFLLITTTYCSASYAVDNVAYQIPADMLKTLKPIELDYNDQFDLNKPQLMVEIDEQKVPLILLQLPANHAEFKLGVRTIIRRGQKIDGNKAISLTSKLRRNKKGEYVNAFGRPMDPVTISLYKRAHRGEALHKPTDAPLDLRRIGGIFKPLIILYDENFQILDSYTDELNIQQRGQLIRTYHAKVKAPIQAQAKYLVITTNPEWVGRPVRFSSHDVAVTNFAGAYSSTTIYRYVKSIYGGAMKLSIKMPTAQEAEPHWDYRGIFTSMEYGGTLGGKSPWGESSGDVMIGYAGYLVQARKLLYRASASLAGFSAELPHAMEFAVLREKPAISYGLGIRYYVSTSEREFTINKTTDFKQTVRQGGRLFAQVELTTDYITGGIKVGPSLHQLGNGSTMHDTTAWVYLNWLQYSM